MMAWDKGLFMGVMGNYVCVSFPKYCFNMCIEHVKYFPKESGLNFNSRIPSKYATQT